MEKHVLFGFFALCLASTVICKLGAPGGPMKLHRDSPDGFKTMEKFEHALAISDSDNDTVFECMTSTRVDINPETMTATYAISLPKPGNVLLFQITPGSSPGWLMFKSDLDPNTKDGVIYYTDYENCVVADKTAWTSLWMSVESLFPRTAKTCAPTWMTSINVSVISSASADHVFIIGCSGSTNF
uniref:Putative lipocalin-5 1 n=1 Tax=Rhipicephalus microplus TaxID=6941 RepID=A0A6M2D9A3_RHIMP